MKLKRDVDLVLFMEAVQRCRHDVYLDTADGSHLDLKSALSQFVFASTVAERLEELDAEICCEDEDRSLLLPFLEE